MRQNRSRHTHKPKHIVHTESFKQAFLKILTDKKVVLTLQCRWSSPEEVLPLSCLPLSLHLCGLLLQRPTTNRQNQVSQRNDTNTQERRLHCKTENKWATHPRLNTTVFTQHQNQGLGGMTVLNVTVYRPGKI